MPLTLQPTIVVLILRRRLNIMKNKITAAWSHCWFFLLGFSLFYFLGFFFLTWSSFTYTNRLLAFACGTLQNQGKYKKATSVMTNTMESSEKKTHQGKTCLGEEWWQCSDHNMFKPKHVVHFFSFIFCWSEGFSVLSTSWREEDKGQLEITLLLKKSLSLLFLDVTFRTVPVQIG